MPNGRLGQSVVAAEQACEIYSNSSGSAAAVTLFANTLSTDKNSKITTVVSLASTDFNKVSTVFDIGANGVGIGTTISRCLEKFAGFNYCNPYQCDAGKQLIQGMTTGFYRAQLCADWDWSYNSDTCSVGSGRSTRTPWAYMEYVSIAGSVTSSFCCQYCANNGSQTYKDSSAGYPYTGCCNSGIMCGTCIGACFSAATPRICKTDWRVKAPYGGTTIHSLTLGLCRTCIYDGCDCNNTPNFNSSVCNYCCRGCSRWSHVVGIIPGWCNFQNWTGHCCGRGRMKDFYMVTACNVDTSNYDMAARMTVNPRPIGEGCRTYCGGSANCEWCWNSCAANVGLVPYCGVCCCDNNGGQGNGPKRCHSQWGQVGGAHNPECRWWCTCMWDVGSFANWWATDPSQWKNFCEHHCIDADGNFYSWRRCSPGGGGGWQQCCGKICQPENWGWGEYYKCDNNMVTGGAGVFAMHWDRECILNGHLNACICCSSCDSCGNWKNDNYCTLNTQSYSRFAQVDGWNNWYCWPQCCCGINCNSCMNGWQAKNRKNAPMSPYGVACAVSCGLYIASIQNQGCGFRYNVGFPHIFSSRCCDTTNQCVTMIEINFGLNLHYTGVQYCLDGNNYNICYAQPDWEFKESNCCSGAEFPLKYFAYNPRKCCHYGLFRAGIASDAALASCCKCAALNGKNPICGVFSFNAKRINKSSGVCKNGNAAYNSYECGCISETRINMPLCYSETGTTADHFKWSVCPKLGIVTTFWCKVANFPSDWLCQYYVSPRMCVSCLFRYSFSEWTISLYNCDSCSWDPWTSKDLITWDKSPFFQTVCESPLHTCCLCTLQAKVISTQDTFMKCIDCSGVLDLCTDMNQYERTGLVLSDGEKIFIKNHSTSNNINVQVWGYEG